MIYITLELMPAGGIWPKFYALQHAKKTVNDEFIFLVLQHIILLNAYAWI